MKKRCALVMLMMIIMTLPVAVMMLLVMIMAANFTRQGNIDTPVKNRRVLVEN